MGTDDRVVLRSSWGATTSVIFAATAGMWIGTLLAGGSYPAPIFLGTFVVASVVFRWLRRTVLTDRGLEVWAFRGRLIPWSEITGVVVGGRRWNQRYITLRRPPDQAFIRLPAPVAPWGIGSRHLHRARDLVEGMWFQHRDDPAPGVSSAYSPPDLWLPPEPQ